MKNKKGVKNSSIVVPGFHFAGVSAGIKGDKKLDLALIVSDRPAKAAATFTTNALKAAPVLQGQRVLKGGMLQAVVVNSGNANAATGPQGLKHSFQTAKAVARLLKISANHVLVSSTGKIGVPLPVKKIIMVLPHAVRTLSPRKLSLAAKAICTTDAFPKIYRLSGKLGGRPYSIVGLAKGAGMIEPRMATMLAYILTDLDLPLAPMRKLFSEVVEATFNSITVDGDTSPNDTALLMANAASRIPPLKPGSLAWKKFAAGLFEVCQQLAWMMVADGEGASKCVEIHIKGAKNAKSAKKIAFSIARSQLVKTSFFGEDPNWGRIFAAAGYSGETLDPSKVDIFYGPISLVKRGRPLSKVQEAKAHRLMKTPAFQVTMDLHLGKGEAKVWTSDLTYGYVKINAEYRT